MQRRPFKLTGFALGAAMAIAAVGAVAADGITYRQVADMLYLVMSSDRAVYTRMVVQRLTRDEKILTASEHFEDDSALPLPGADVPLRRGDGGGRDRGLFLFAAFHASDQQEERSRNGAGTEGLEYVAANPGENFYGEEELGGQRYFAAVYPGPCGAEACVSCHNNHKDSPRTDAEVGDVMGGVVIRIRWTDEGRGGAPPAPRDSSPRIPGSMSPVQGRKRA